jgi:hypothetical protein
VWAWLGGYDVAHPDAGALFGEAELLAVPALQEQTGRQLNALLATMSFWARLSAAQREALSAAHESLHRRLGRPIRSSTAACLVTARRTPRAAAAVDG